MPLAVEKEYPAFAEKIQKAREAGYKDEEIRRRLYIREQRALRAGYSQEDIDTKLGRKKVEHRAPSVEATPESMSGIYPTEIPGVTDVAQDVAAFTTMLPSLALSGAAGIYKGATSGKKGDFSEYGINFDLDAAMKGIEEMGEKTSVPLSEGPTGRALSSIFEGVRGFWQTVGETSPTEYAAYGDIAAPSLEPEDQVTNSPWFATAVATLGELATYALLHRAGRSIVKSKGAKGFAKARTEEFREAFNKEYFEALKNEDKKITALVPLDKRQALAKIDPNWRFAEKEPVAEAPRGEAAFPTKQPKAIVGETPAIHEGGYFVPTETVGKPGRPEFIMSDVAGRRIVRGPRNPYELPTHPRFALEEARRPPIIPEVPKPKETPAPSTQEGVGVLAPEKTGFLKPTKGKKGKPPAKTFAETLRGVEEKAKEGVKGKAVKEEAVKYDTVLRQRAAKGTVPVVASKMKYADGTIVERFPNGEVVVRGREAEAIGRVNADIKRHIPEAPENPVEFVRSEAGEGGVPRTVYRDNLNTGKEFTLKRTASDVETIPEALARIKGENAGLPTDILPYALTKSVFRKWAGNIAGDPTSPARKFIRPALRIGDELIVGKDATTHAGVYMEAMDNGSWPVDVDPGVSESTFAFNGTEITFPDGTKLGNRLAAFFTDPDKFHGLIVENAIRAGKSVPKSVLDEYPEFRPKEVGGRKGAKKGPMFKEEGSSMFRKESSVRIGKKKAASKTNGKPRGSEGFPMPRTLVDELNVLERDTLDKDSPPAKARFVDALESATKKGKGYELQLDREQAQYLHDNLEYHMDIWGERSMDRGERLLKAGYIRSATALRRRLKAYLDKTKGKKGILRNERGGLDPVMIEKIREGGRKFLDWISDVSKGEFADPLRARKLGEEGSKWYKARRGTAFGDLDRVGVFITKIFNKLNMFDYSLRYDMFQFLRGHVPLEFIPKEVRPVAAQLRRLNQKIGKMLVREGLITDETFQNLKDSYVHYMYLWHHFGEGPKVGAGGKMDLGTFKHRKGLTYQQQMALELVEDVRTAVPIGLGKSLGDLFQGRFFRDVANNQNLTWQHSRAVADYTPDGKPILMGLGQIMERLERYQELAAKKGGLNPQAQDAYNRLIHARGALEQVEGKAPEHYKKMPVSKHYGELSGVYVHRSVFNDIVPLFEGLRQHHARWWETGLRGFEQATAAFKVGKVALNPPTVFRNVVSNFLQINMSGVPWYRVGGVVGGGIKSFVEADMYYNKARRLGLFRTNWTVAEIGEVAKTLKEVEAMGLQGTAMAPFEFAKRLAKYYGRIDDIAKLSLFKDGILRRGMSEIEAAIHAQKWGMDYSNVGRGMKAARRYVLPFFSYQYKIAPLIMETLRYRPWVIAKFALVPWVLGKIAQSTFDWTDKDLAKYQKELGERTRHKGSFVILPVKDAKGRIKFFNMEYFFPWGNWQEFLKDVKAKDPWGATAALNFGGWWANIVYMLTRKWKGNPPVDPFSGMDLYSRMSEDGSKIFKIFEWAYGLFAPSFATRYGSLGKTKRAITGEKDRWNKVVSPGEAFLSYFGVNVGVLDRRQLMAIRAARIDAIKTDYRRQMRDSKISREEKIEISKRYRKLVRKALRGED